MINFTRKFADATQPIEKQMGKMLAEAIGRPRQDMPFIMNLIFGGAALDEKDSLGNTPLLISLMTGNAGLAHTLLRKGANIEARTPEGHNALMIAAARGETSIVTALVRMGASLNETSRDGESAIDLAREQGHHRIAEIIEKAQQDAATAAFAGQHRQALARYKASLLPS